MLKRVQRKKWQRFFLIRNQLLAGIFTLILTLLLGWAGTLPSLSQTPTPHSTQKSTPTSKKELIAKIKEKLNEDLAFRIENKLSPDLKEVDKKVEPYKKKLTSQEIEEIESFYKNEYTRLKKAKDSDLWEKVNDGLLDGLGWFAALFFLILCICKETLQKVVSSFFNAVGTWIYNRCAGTRLLRGIALRHYRKGLIEKCQELKIPFRPNRPLKIREIYVPLKVTGTRDNEQLDAYGAVSKYRRLMVKGAPGSGKSMLLKYLALSYAEGRLNLPDQPVPVLLELHRLSKSDKSLEQHFVEALDRDDFPHSQLFIEHSLAQGTLMLLLDGLDEVNSDNRWQVVAQIKDLLDKHPNCRVVITCRTAVYKGEFDDLNHLETLEVVEFIEQQIRDFLKAWKQYMPPGKSIEQLMQTLHDRPRIMALARNPLMLTIIAYLYADTSLVLPRSRAEFYRKSTDILLDQWHHEHNLFQAREKRFVLQDLAIYNQDITKQQQPDSASIKFKTVLQQIKLLLPELNLQPDQDALPLLNEIVERSSLLIKIDGGEKYQFAHLTLQEFFAASKLIDDKDGLLTRFKADNDAWRETVKLWCGLAGDSTDLIREVRTISEITAFECLADAQRVDLALADEIINRFKDQLGKGSNDEVVNRAFASVAADDWRRTEVFNFLKDTLENIGEIDARREAAAKALSMTNLAEAADVLARQYADRAELRPVLHSALVRMGDLAVSKISYWVEAGVMESSLVESSSVELMDILVDIGTPTATQMLVSWIWHSNQSLASSAALLLAHLLRHSEQEKVIESYKLTEDQKRVKERLDWIWKPFETSTNSNLSIIAGRVAYLISRVPLEIANSVRVLSLDPRLIIPICSIELYDQKTNLVQIKWKHLLVSIKKGIEIAKEKESRKISIERYDNEMGKLLDETETLWDFLFLKIEPSLQIILLYQYVSYPRLRQEYWYDSIIKIEKEKRTKLSVQQLQAVMFSTMPATIVSGVITGLFYFGKTELRKLINLIPSNFLIQKETLFIWIVISLLIWLNYCILKYRKYIEYNYWFVYWSFLKLVRGRVRGETRIRMIYWEWRVEERTLRGVVNMGMWIERFEGFLEKEIGEELGMEMDAEWQKIKDAV